VDLARDTLYADHYVLALRVAHSVASDDPDFVPEVEVWPPDGALHARDWFLVHRNVHANPDKAVDFAVLEADGRLLVL
jgi:hypothetical protein